MPIRTPPKHSQSFNSVPRQSWDSAQSKPFLSPEVRVVEASAGSGKTYALAKRYVQLLLNPAIQDQQNLMRSILAVTFTNKAALEMKARILDFLKRIALGAMPEEELREILEPFVIPAEAGIQDIELDPRQKHSGMTVEKHFGMTVDEARAKIGRAHV